MFCSKDGATRLGCRVLAATLLVAFICAPAQAATTVYASSIFSQNLIAVSVEEVIGGDAICSVGAIAFDP